MEQIWHDSGAFFALIAASGALAGTSILERRARTLRLSSILATILVLASGLAFTQSTVVAFALGLPAIGFLVMASARHVQSYVERVASFAVQSRTLHACVILIGGPLLAWGLATHADNAAASPDLDKFDPFEVRLRQALMPASQPAYTDRGQHFTLFRISPAFDCRNLDQRDNEVHGDLAQRTLRRSPPDAKSNCHGWVFSGGPFWIDNPQVEQILLENEYQKTTQPRSGDLIIYRDDLGFIVHSGVVRLNDDGRILVESKWGTMGCFLHAPADQIFSQTWAFYRSARSGGHHLRGQVPDDSAGPGGKLDIESP